MRKYGKWVLTLSLLAATPGLTFAASPKLKDSKPSAGTKASRTDNQRVAEDIANALRGRVQGDISIEYKDGTAVLASVRVRACREPRVRHPWSEGGGPGPRPLEA